MNILNIKCLLLSPVGITIMIIECHSLHLRSVFTRNFDFQNQLRSQTHMALPKVTTSRCSRCFCMASKIATYQHPDTSRDSSPPQIDLKPWATRWPSKGRCQVSAKWRKAEKPWFPNLLARSHGHTVADVVCLNLSSFVWIQEKSIEVRRYTWVSFENFESEQNKPCTTIHKLF